MKLRMNSLAALGLSAVALSFGGNAQAGFIAAICDDINCTGGGDMIVTDNGAGDTAPGVNGFIMFSFTTGGLTVIGNTSQSKPLLGSAASPQLDLTFSVTGIGTAFIFASDNDFTGVGNLTGSVDGNFSGASTVQARVWGGTNNTSPPPFPGPLLASTAVLSTSPFSGTFPAGIQVGLAANPYVLTIGAIVTRTTAGTTTGDLNVRVVPEPASLALLGIGLVALGFSARRKQA